MLCPEGKSMEQKISNSDTLYTAKLLIWYLENKIEPRLEKVILSNEYPEKIINELIKSDLVAKLAGISLGHCIDYYGSEKAKYYYYARKFPPFIYPSNKRKPISNKLRFKILSKHNYTCQYCGRKSPEVKLAVDHIKPVARGGDDKEENLTLACEECNLGKSESMLSLGTVPHSVKA